MCLMASLLISHTAACACSHHAENTADCHSRHEAAEMAEIAGEDDACDTGCVCSVEQPSPYAASKSPAKDFETTYGELARSAPVIPNIEFAAIIASAGMLPEFVTNLTHSATFKSLLRPRAPPRL